MLCADVASSETGRSTGNFRGDGMFGIHGPECSRDRGEFHGRRLRSAVQSAAADDVLHRLERQAETHVATAVVGTGRHAPRWDRADGDHYCRGFQVAERSRTVGCATSASCRGRKLLHAGLEGLDTGLLMGRAGVQSSVV